MPGRTAAVNRPKLSVRMTRAGVSAAVRMMRALTSAPPVTSVAVPANVVEGCAQTLAADARKPARMRAGAARILGLLNENDLKIGVYIRQNRSAILKCDWSQLATDLPA